MKKALFLLISFLFLSASTVQAGQILWGIDPDGNLMSDNYFGNQWYVQIANSWSHTETYGLSPTDFDGEFRDWGVIGLSPSSTAGNLDSNYEITGVYDYTGTISDGTLNFTAGYLDIYIGDETLGTKDFNEDDSPDNIDGSYLGANTGTWIGRFLVTGGSGEIPASGQIGTTEIDNIDVVYVADDLLAGYWGYDADGDLNTTNDTIDLSTVAFELTLGHSNTTSQSETAQRIDDELQEFYTVAKNRDDSAYTGALDLSNAGTPSVSQLVTHSGEFDLKLVPEPSTFLLLGIGLLGFAGIGRRKISS